MKKIFSKFFLVALLSVLGVNNSFADWQTVSFVSSDASNVDGNEGAKKLCDGKTDTKWCSEGGMVGKYVIFSTSSAITLKAYRLTHGGDTKGYTDRGWRNWSLYGSTSSSSTGSWILLDEIVDNAIISEQQEIRYLPHNTQSFQYYKIVVNKLQNGNTGQMAEIEVTADNLSTDITIRPGYVYGNETSGYNYQDKFSKLVDVDATASGSKWCCTNFSSPNADGAMHLVVDARYPIKLTSHSFWSGDDTKQYSERQLKAWKLYGSNNTTTWNLLFTSGSGEYTSTENNTQTNHAVSGVTVAYRYYKFVPTASGDNGSKIQLMDFKLTGTLDTPLEVVFNSNQGSGSMPSQVIWSGDSLRANTFAGPSGKTVFVGWNTKADGSGTAYANKALIEKSSITSGSMTLYAQWGSECTVTYDANTGSGSMDSHTINTVEGTLKTNTFTAPSADHVFIGWNTQADGSGVSYTDGARIITTTSPASLNLYAQWVNKTQVESLLKPVEIDVNSFNGNCVIGKTETPSDVYESGKPKMYLDNAGAFFSKETDFTKLGSSSYYSTTYGMQASDTINDGNGITIPFHYAWTGTGAFDGLDALHLTAANESHTLMLKTPVALEKLYFCGTAGNLNAHQTTITVTINFTDNSSVSRTFDMQDWFQKTKSKNGRYGYARYATDGNAQYKDGDGGTYGPAVYCLSMNNAVEAKKYIKSITFRQGNTQMYTAIFAITGLQCASAPKEPQNRVCHMTKNTTVISFDEVTKNKVDQTITGVTYEYLISSKSDFSDTTKLADLSFIKQGNRIIGTIDQNYSGYYIRVRAENNAGYSDFVPVPYSHKVTILPYTHGTVVLDPTSADSTYASGTDIKLTATPATNYAFKGWVVEEDTITTNPYTIDSITYDWTVQPLFSINTVTVTFKENGGVLEGEKTKQFTIGQPYGTLPTPTYEKHNFQGWFTDSIGGDTVKSTTVVTQTTDHYLWAQWKEEEVDDGEGKSFDQAKSDVDTKLAKWVAECEGSKAINLTIKRKIYKDTYYNTLCLPFDLSATQINATFREEPKELKEFKSATVTGTGSGRTIEIELEDATEITAGKAYLISFNNGETMTQLEFQDVIVTKTSADEVSDEQLDYQGILAPYTLPYEDQDYLFVGDNNKLYWPKKDDTFMKGFRAYFKVTTAAPGSPYKRGMKAAFGDKKTPTSVHDAQCTMHEIQKLIEQGRVVIITNGKKYDLQGNLLD